MSAFILLLWKRIILKKIACFHIHTSIIVTLVFLLYCIEHTGTFIVLKQPSAEKRKKKSWLFGINFSRNLCSSGYLGSADLPGWFWSQSVAIMFVSAMQLLLFLPFLFHNKVSISIGTEILSFLTWKKKTFFCYSTYFETWWLGVLS